MDTQQLIDQLKMRQMELNYNRQKLNNMLEKVLDEELSHEDDYEVVMRMRREAVVDRANSRGLHTKADE
mgnify:CR=1 FL=1